MGFFFLQGSLVAFHQGCITRPLLTAELPLIFQGLTLLKQLRKLRQVEAVVEALVELGEVLWGRLSLYMDLASSYISCTFYLR